MKNVTLRLEVSLHMNGKGPDVGTESMGHVCQLFLDLL